MAGRRSSSSSFSFSFPMETWSWSVFILLRLVILYPCLISSGNFLCDGRYNSASLYKSEPSSFEFVTTKKENHNHHNNNFYENHNFQAAKQSKSWPLVQSTSQSLSFAPNKNKNSPRNRKIEEPVSKGLITSSTNNVNSKNVLQKRYSFDRYEEEGNFKGWTNIDEDKNENPVWSSTPSSQPHGKTVDIPPLPSLNILEDPGYDHGRPTWPLNEYIIDKFNSFYRPYRNNGTESGASTGTKLHHYHHHNNNQYEWQKLQPAHFGSTASGSDHNYATKYYDDEDRYRDRHQAYSIYNGHPHYHRHHASGYDRGHESGTNEHTTTVSTATDVKGSSSSTSESSNRGVEKHGYGYPPYGHHYFPPDHYPKKRFRLQIHPGYIAAPLAGLAAFGAASALTNKPLLFELGLVNNRYPHYHGHHHHHHGPGIHYPGAGWASNVVPVVPPLHSHVNPPIIAGQGGPGGPTFPILNPQASHHHSQIHPQHGHHHNHHHHLSNHHTHHPHHNNYHGHHQPEADKKPWWNPFAALTPRD